METRRLEAFVKIVDAGTLTRAAEQLRIAQPSLSQQVLDLEAQFGAKLLTRTKQGVSPTQAGEQLYRHAQIVLQQLEQAVADIRGADVAVSGWLTVGLPGSIAPLLGLPLLRHIRKRFPAVTLRVIEGSYALISELTLNARLDLSLSSEMIVKGVRRELLLTDELVLVSGHTGAAASLASGTISFAALADQPLLLPTRLGMVSSLVHDAFALHQLTPKLVGELDSPYDLLQAVSEGLGSTIIAWPAAAHLSKSLVVRRIVDPQLPRPIYIYEPDAKPATVSSLAIKQLLVEIVTGMVQRNEWPGAVWPDATPIAKGERPRDR